MISAIPPPYARGQIPIVTTPHLAPHLPHIHEPPAVLRFSRFLLPMAIVTGVLVRLYRDVLLASTTSSSWAFLIITYLGQPIILLGLATAHLGNYPIKHWLWRVPLFGFTAGLAEAGMSGLLIAAHFERMGTAVAHGHEWSGIAIFTVAVDTIIVIVFGLVLAAVMQVIRFALLKREHRAHTVTAVHESREHPATAAD